MTALMSLSQLDEITKSNYVKAHPVEDNRMSLLKHTDSAFRLPEIFKNARAGKSGEVLRLLTKAMEKEPTAKAIIDRRCLTTGRAALHEAACFGHRKVIDLLCGDLKADINNKTLMGGDTALHLAAMKNHRAICFHLITTYEADPEIQNKFGWTPLHYAAEYGSLSVVKCLCQYGAKTATKTSDGQTASQIAFARGAQDEMIEYFLKVTEEQGRGEFLEQLEGKKLEMAEDAALYAAQKAQRKEDANSRFSRNALKEYGKWRFPEREGLTKEYDPMLSKRGQEVLWRREAEAWEKEKAAAAAHKVKSASAESS
mmetsp:Transcript_82179/g.160394  ORF Transcript_82179/g.160394 Transcript_82179/m.160394 type:complete len:313 (+) Transcript_82179:104-1042(+)